MARKYLVPLTTLLAASAIAVGSGASFTSQSVNAASGYTAGSLEMINSRAGAAVFSQGNLKPGDVVNGTLTITNSGSLPATMALTETLSTNGFTGSNLELTITDTTTGASQRQIFSGTFGALVDGAKTALPGLSGATWAPKESHTYEFKAVLALSTPNADQNKTASATFQWDGTQVNDGDTYNQ